MYNINLKERVHTDPAYREFKFHTTRSKSGVVRIFLNDRRTEYKAGGGGYDKVSSVVALMINDIMGDDIVSYNGVGFNQIRDEFTRLRGASLDVLYTHGSTIIYHIRFPTAFYRKLFGPDLSNIEHYLVNSIDLSGYNVSDDINTKAKLEIVANNLKREAFYPFNIEKFNVNKIAIIADHLKGLPSYLNIPFEYSEIEDFTHKMGITGDYWETIAKALLSLFKKYKIKGGVK